MKDVLKRISWCYYLITLIIIVTPIIAIKRFGTIELDIKYVTFMIGLYVLCVIVNICGIRDDIINNKNLKTLIGLPSGDYEVEVFDCTKKSFEDYTGELADESAESCFYKDLYRAYRIPITEQMRKLSIDDNLLKIKVSDKGVQSVKKLKQKATELTPNEIKY